MTKDMGRAATICASCTWLSSIRLVAIAALVSGCDVAKNVTQAGVDYEGPSAMPTLKDMQSATAPGFKSAPGNLPECLGRLTFDVPQAVQWPTFYKNDAAGLFNRSFSENVADAGDEMRFGDTRVAVIEAPTMALRSKVLEGTPMALIARLQRQMEETRLYVTELKKKMGPSEATAREIKRAEKTIASWREAVREDQANIEPFAAGLADSVSYWTSEAIANDEAERFSILRTYLTRGDRIYVFESRSTMDRAAAKEAHKKEFIALLNQFRPRVANEIPVELGVCIPFGFIQDDGRTLTEFKQSIRFKNAPGVLYTIQTGNVHSRNIKGAGLLAATRAATGTLGSAEEEEIKPFIKQRIGPRPFPMGGLTGEQGGIVLEIARSGASKYEAYSVFTGYSGWLGTAVLPYILVDMRTVSKDQAPELKQDPPPFQQSMDRLQVILKGMRLRQTTPPMPELVPGASAR